MDSNEKALETLALKIFKECEMDGEPVTKEEAMEMAEMEIKAKGIKNYVKGAEAEKKPRKPREVKLDDEKVDFIGCLKTLLGGMVLNGKISNVQIANPQKELTFNIGENEYSLSLIKHRKKK